LLLKTVCMKSEEQAACWVSFSLGIFQIHPAEIGCLNMSFYHLIISQFAMECIECITFFRRQIIEQCLGHGFHTVHFPYQTVNNWRVPINYRMVIFISWLVLYLHSVFEPLYLYIIPPYCFWAIFISWLNLYLHIVFEPFSYHGWFYTFILFLSHFHITVGCNTSILFLAHFHIMVGDYTSILFLNHFHIMVGFYTSMLLLNHFYIFLLIFIPPLCFWTIFIYLHVVFEPFSYHGLVCIPPYCFFNLWSPDLLMINHG
jgi:hypothetical protein